MSFSKFPSLPKAHAAKELAFISGALYLSVYGGRFGTLQSARGCLVTSILYDIIKLLYGARGPQDPLLF